MHEPHRSEHPGWGRAKDWVQSSPDFSNNAAICFIWRCDLPHSKPVAQDPTLLSLTQLLRAWLTWSRGFVGLQTCRTLCERFDCRCHSLPRSHSQPIVSSQSGNQLPAAGLPRLVQLKPPAAGEPPGCLVSHLTACCMKRSGSTAENVVSTVPVGTPSSSLISLWFVGKYGASLTSVTEMVTPAVDWKDIWMPLARGAWFDTITVSMKALFIS